MERFNTRITKGQRLTEPVVDPEVGKEVPHEHVGPSECLGEVDESSSSNSDADVAQDDELCIPVLVQGASRVEVVNTTAETVALALATALALTLVVVVASDVGDQVVGPADQLLEDKHDEGESGSLLGQLGKFVDQFADAVGMLLTSARNKDHVSLHVAGGLVVLAMGDLPAEVGHKERRVKDPSGEVVDKTRVGEGAVTALVGNDPETSPEETLENSVHAPEDSSGGGRRNVLGGNEVVPEGEGGREADDVAEDVAVSLQGGALEAVLGNGIVDVLDGEVGRSEFVAVGVEETGILGLGLVDIDRRQRREGGGRSRSSGGIRWGYGC